MKITNIENGPNKGVRSVWMENLHFLKYKRNASWPARA